MPFSSKTMSNCSQSHLPSEHLPQMKGTMLESKKKPPSDIQSEKETLSIVFDAGNFHEYLYGYHFTVFNDYQPLKTIFNKSIAQCPPRIQRFFMKLQKYDFDLEYSPGKTMVVLDGHSRAYLNHHSTKVEEVDLIHSVQVTFDTLPSSEARLNHLQQEPLRTRFCNNLSTGDQRSATFLH